MLIIQNRSKMKNIIQYSLFFSFIFLSSCSNISKPEDTKDIAEEHNEAKFNTLASVIDAQFLVNVASVNMEEIKLGRYAQKKSKMPDIRALAKNLEILHLKSLAEITVLAKNKLITIPTMPTNEAKDAYKSLNGKFGTSFDEAYCNIVVNSHTKAISSFEQISTETLDKDIKAWTLSMIPSLRTYLDEAITCQTKYEKLK